MRLAIVLLLALATATGCRAGALGQPESPRTLESVLPHLTSDLTPATAREKLGAPDEETGSGLIIYKYRLTEGRTLLLGFPGYRPITYAQVEDRNGNRTVLGLR